LSKHLMDVQTRRAPEALLIDVKGQIDLFSSPKLRAAILAAINTKEVSRVAINMNEVAYMDSSGVASLVEGLQLARTKKCLFVIFGLQQGAKEVLELARLNKIFTIRDTEEEALATQ
jgi:anti-sigma B factor antagonist